MAIDYGKKRTGVAVTDPLQMIANGLETVATHELEKFLVSYFQKEKVDLVAMGYPKQMNNQPSENVTRINHFLNRFKKVFPNVPVELVDERFTSQIAFQAMIDGGVKKEKRKDKGLVDKVSASLILQSYLEQRNNKF